MKSALWGAPLLLLLCTAAGPIELSLPLDGHYRPGKYIPVKFRADFAASSSGYVELGAQGAVPTRIFLSEGEGQGIAPLLLIGSNRQITWRASRDSGRLDGPLKGVGEGQRLVGFTTVDLPFAKELFKDDSIIPILLDITDPIPGPAVAWEALDAVVLDATAARPEDDKLAGLLAGGVVVAYRSVVKPDERWPWKRRGEYWVLSADIAGPRFSSEYPVPFAPIQGWEAGWSAPLRWRIVLYGVVFAILALGLSLMRLRFTPLMLLGLSMLFCGLLAVWARGKSAVLIRGVEIRIVNEQMTQSDRWSYFAAANNASLQYLWDAPVCRPLFEQSGDRALSGLVLQCDSSGNPSEFIYRLRATMKLAILCRSVTPSVQQMKTQDVPATAPPLSLVRRLYLRPEDALVGEIVEPSAIRPEPAGNELWRPILIRHASQ